MPEDPRPESDFDPEAQLSALGRSLEAGEFGAKEAFEKTSHVAQLMAHDLIDKLRFWEKHTLQLTEDEITLRLSHLARSVDSLRAAYLTFSDLDF